MSGTRTRVAGGSINDAFREVREDGTVAFVKSRQGAHPEEFPAEAEGLRWLGEAGGVAVPEVLSVGPDHLALRWVESGAVDEELLGRGLARTHAAGADAFGSPHPLRIGELTLPSDPAPDYATFLAERRLLPLARLAADRTGLEPAPVEALCARLSDRLGPPQPPARVHGDLWTGNVIGRGRGVMPVVVDPVAHGGDGEADLAMLELFGSPSARFYAAYDELRPPAPGRDERRALHQLVPLLVHAVLFGGGYAAQAAAVARRYA